MATVTVMQVAEHLGIDRDSDGSVNAGEILKWDLPFIGGCQACEATIASYNAAPTKTGFLQCVECAEANNVGYETVEDAIADIYDGRTAEQVRVDYTT